MGRVSNRPTAYFWVSKKDGLRKGWFFPSRLAADRWKRHECWDYVQNMILENHLSLHSESRWRRETEIWSRHKDKWEDLVLRRAKIVY